MKKTLCATIFASIISLFTVLSPLSVQAGTLQDKGTDMNQLMYNETADIQQTLYSQIKEIIADWQIPEDVYAISFFVYPNEVFEYEGYSNLPEFCISYNTETMCEGAGEYDEERWNYAFWLQNEVPIIQYSVPSSNADLFLNWLKENGIDNIGEEESDPYDEDLNYIGKGPGGTYELTMLAAQIAGKLHEDSVIQDKFGEDLPIIIHDLEYTWYTLEATRTANPDHQADDFFQFIQDNDFGELPEE